MCSLYKVLPTTEGLFTIFPSIFGLCMFNSCECMCVCACACVCESVCDTYVRLITVLRPGTCMSGCVCVCRCVMLSVAWYLCVFAVCVCPNTRLLHLSEQLVLHFTFYNYIYIYKCREWNKIKYTFSYVSKKRSIVLWSDA